MIELYFLIYRIPKMMTALARERNRSALAWSLMGIAAWIGGEFVVAVILGLVYGLGSAILGWPGKPPGLFVLFSYVATIGAAIGSLTLVRRVLSNKSRDKDSFPLPPPPPRFE